MEDKKLDDLMKDLQTYTKQVAHEKKLEKLEAMREPFIFPWKYVIIGTAVAIWYFWSPIKFYGNKVAEQERVQEMLRALDQSDSSKLANEVVQQGNDVRENKDPKSPTLKHSEAALAEARKVASEAAFVKIEGKYYRKSPDNVYNINGRRVFFIDNRKAAAAQNASE